mmetsp:Transcript_74554/g.199367  ORF Transcript_74554/g.199367 Transcript_74554/m.199367 type:complete len:199 (-) Transcript_74554:339-935(-)
MGSFEIHLFSINYLVVAWKQHQSSSSTADGANRGGGVHTSESSIDVQDPSWAYHCPSCRGCSPQRERQGARRKRAGRSTAKRKATRLAAAAMSVAGASPAGGQSPAGGGSSVATDDSGPEAEEADPWRASAVAAGLSFDMRRSRGGLQAEDSPAEASGPVHTAQGSGRPGGRPVAVAGFCSDVELEECATGCADYLYR